MPARKRASCITPGLRESKRRGHLAVLHATSFGFVLLRPFDHRHRRTRDPQLGFLVRLLYALDPRYA